MDVRLHRRMRQPLQLHWLMLTLSLSFIAWIVIGL
jgi:hypothetical protein